MLRSFVTTSIVLALVTSVACGKDKPAGTTPPEDAATTAGTAGAPDGDARADDTDDTGDEGGQMNADTGGATAAPSDDVATKVCEAQVSNAPAAVFEESMLLRLPKGLEADALIEQSPFFVRASPFESTSCIEDMPGAMVSFTAMGYFEDSGQDMQKVRDETLNQLGYPAQRTFSEEQIKGRRLEVAVEVPADPKAGKADPAKAWFVLKSGYGRMYYVIYEVHPRAWNAMRNTLKASTDKLLLRNPSG